MIALGITISFVLSEIGHQITGIRVYGPESARTTICIDLAFLALSLWVALREDAYWPVLISSTALVQVITSLAEMAFRFHGWVYGTAQLTWLYVILISLLIGVCTARPEPRAVRSGAAGG